MTNIAIIPARIGSKRIPQKNIRLFAGKPMIAYAIEAARNCGLFNRVVVTTESEEIADTARTYGAEVPFLRPTELADDFTPVLDAVAHALERLMKEGPCDFFCCIYPAVPFLDPREIRRAHKLLVDGSHKFVLSVAPYASPIQRSLRIDGDGYVVMSSPNLEMKQSQQLETVYHDAGQFFWGHSETFLAKRRILSAQPKALVLNGNMIHDINTTSDWEAAEMHFKALHSWLRWRGRDVADFAPAASDIVLGTAQLGMAYGIMNRANRPSVTCSYSILEAAWRSGTRIFDTAQAYGSSEETLGQYFDDQHFSRDVRFVTKLSPSVDVYDGNAIRNAVMHSIERLRVRRLWGLMLHREQQIENLNGILGRVLRELKEDGKISNVGVSVYSPRYALSAVEHPLVSMVQIPANVFDRRMIRAGIHARAMDTGKAIFVRSIFLQGVALAEPDRAPPGIPGALEAVAILRKFCARHGLSPREFAFDYVRARLPLSLIVIGADNPVQAFANGLLAERPPLDPSLLDEWDQNWPDDCIDLIDASRWKIPIWSRLSRNLTRTFRTLWPTSDR